MILKSVRELIAELKDINPDTVILADIWTADDIRNINDSLEEAPTARILKIMTEADEKYTPENGLNNDILAGYDDK